jgi:L-lysine exporter family protein LysE/ArgO
MPQLPFAPIFASGFALGLSLIAAIGAQNAFVLRQGVIGRHVGMVVAICAVSDALLIALGTWGAGALAAQAETAARLMRWGGAAFLIAYGLRSLIAAWRGGAALGEGGEAPRSAAKVAATALALTFGNPHVYLDTMALVGSVAASSSRPQIFALGAMTASVLFFSGLGYGARLLRPLFAQPAAWRALDLGTGLLMLTLGATLLAG